MKRVARFCGSIIVVGLVALLPPVTAGQEWTEDVRLTDNPAASGLTYNFARSVAADEDGVVHVVWYDERDGDQQVYYKRSADDGASWRPDTRLSEHEGVHMDHDPLLPAVAVCGSRVYVVWHAPQKHRQDVYLRRSNDEGITWESTVRLSNGLGSSAHASIAAAEDNVHVVFGDQRDGQAEVYYTRSNDAGTTWDEERRLTDVPYISWVPCVTAEGKYVFLAWIDGRDGNEELYVKRSVDSGKTWGPDTRLTTDSANSWAPSLAVVGDTAHLVWFDQQHASQHPLDVEKKLDAVPRLLGLPVPPVPSGVMVPHPEESARLRAEQRLRRIHEEASGWIKRGGDEEKLQAIMRQFEEMGMIRSALPAWVRSGGNVKKVESRLEQFHREMETASHDWEIYYTRSTDAGATWEPAARLTHSPDLSHRPTIAAAGNELHVVWFDRRDGNLEVYHKESFDGGNTWSKDTRLTHADGESQRSA